MLGPKLSHAIHRSQSGTFKIFSPILKGAESFLYSSGGSTKGLVHVRDWIDLKRVMILIALAMLPTVIVGIYNTGLQLNYAHLMSGNALLNDVWQFSLFQMLGFLSDSTSLTSNWLLGIFVTLPLLFVIFLGGLLLETVFSLIRKREIDESFLISIFAFWAILPPTIPLWCAFIGITFGMLFGKEVFGGIGKNFLSPVLIGYLFISLAYPEHFSSLKVTASHSISELLLGFVPGTIASMSSLAIILGGVFLLITGIVSFRILLPALIMLPLTMFILPLICAHESWSTSLSLIDHICFGGFLFVLIFITTESSASALTPISQWAQGFLIGLLTAVIRFFSHSPNDGIIIATLTVSLVVPLLDYFVVRLHVRKLRKRASLSGC